MSNQFALKTGNFLFNYFYPVYKLIYFLFKKKQDKHEIKLLKKNIHKGSVVLDIGANIGFYSWLFSRWVGSTGKIISFEPDLLNFRRLKDNTDKLKNTIIFNKAVGKENGKITLYQSDILNVDHRTYQPETYTRSYSVDVVALDDFLSDISTSVDFVKIDIQGFEYNAVKGMMQLLRKNKQIKILSEFWPYGLKKSGSSAVHYFELLSNLGFTVFLLENKNMAKLSISRVTEMNELPEKNYFNIFISRDV
jgi:FkbM family methyltransferase